MEFRVNERCIGCGLCTSICPEIFEMTFRGVAQAKPEQVSPEVAELGLEAQTSCPADAIETEH